MKNRIWRRRWSTPERRVLAELWSRGMAVEQIAVALKRSAYSVYNEACRLGLSRHPRFDGAPRCGDAR